MSLPLTTILNESQLERFTSVISAAFAGDALNRAAMLFAASLPNSTVFTTEQREQYFLSSTKKKAGSGAILVEAGNWAAVALWVPPGVQLAGRERSTLTPFMREYFDKFAEVKKKHLGDRQFWYLNLIGRDPSI